MLPNDPNLLFSVINTKLRDFYPSLEILCDDLDVSIVEIQEKLQSIGYIYDETLNKFK